MVACKTTEIRKTNSRYRRQFVVAQIVANLSSAPSHGQTVDVHTCDVSLTDTRKPGCRPREPRHAHLKYPKAAYQRRQGTRVDANNPWVWCSAMSTIVQAVCSVSASASGLASADSPAAGCRPRPGCSGHMHVESQDLPYMPNRLVFRQGEQERFLAEGVFDLAPPASVSSSRAPSSQSFVRQSPTPTFVEQEAAAGVCTLSRMPRLGCPARWNRHRLLADNAGLRSDAHPETSWPCSTHAKGAHCPSKLTSLSLVMSACTVAAVTYCKRRSGDV